MQLFAVVIEELRRAGIDRVLLYAADQPPEAEGMARDFYLADGKSPLRYRFWAQPVTEVCGPGGALYRVVLRRRP